MNNQTNWKFIGIVVVLAVIVGGGILGYTEYFKREMISFTKLPEIKKPKTFKIVIRRLIQNFYQAIENQNGELLFSYFTPPETPEEKESYNWLIGADLPKPNYRVFLRIKISDPQIEEIKEIEKGKFQINGRDEIHISKAPAYPEEIENISRKVSFIVVKTDKKWLIDKYKWEDPNKIYRTEKYSGFGQEQIIADLTNWKTYRNEEYGFEIKYPENFFYKEPKVAVTDCSTIDISKECPDAIDAVKIITGYSSIDSTYWCFPMKQGVCDPKKEVEMLTSGNISWCLHTHSEGAAGSIYTEYYYTTVKDKKCFTLPLFIRTASSCKNYAKQEDINKCEEFKESLPKILDGVLSTFRLLE